MVWDGKFSEPILLLHKGKELATLHDAALYTTKLPKINTMRMNAGRNAGFASRCRAWRTNDVCTYRPHARACASKWPVEKNPQKGARIWFAPQSHWSSSWPGKWRDHPPGAGHWNLGQN